MPDILIRNVSPTTKERLRRRAKRHGKSLEADLRDTLESIATESEGGGLPGPGFGSWLVSISRPGADLTEPLATLRSTPLRPVDFQ